MNPTNDVMVDLETLDTKPGAVLLSVGAVFFGDEGLGEEFHMIIHRKTSEALGLTVSPDTVAWWEKQSEAARKTLYAASDDNVAVQPDVVFTAFNNFLGKAKGGHSKVRIWGNGSDFDNVLLIAAYEKAGIRTPWKFYNHRCHRTLKTLRPDIKIDRQGTYHNALDDAKSQAEHAIRILKAIRG